MGEEMDAYAVLGVQPYATVEEIKAAYRERARFLHPDRHVREDGTVPRAVHEAFVRLNLALRAALARTAPDAVRVPHQRTPSGSSAVPGSRPAPVMPVVPVTPMSETAAGASDPRGVESSQRTRFDEDPMLVLLTAPQRCRTAWPREALEVWALTLVPAARAHVQEARRLALHAGALASRHRTVATAHALITLTVPRLRGGRRLRRLGETLPAAYDALEGLLPPTVVERLPDRVVLGKGGLGSLLG